MSDLRERARKYLEAVPPFGRQITSDGDAALFTRLTGVTHATLVANWDGGGMLTTCNEFVGHFGKNLGSKDYLGRFDIEQFLKKHGQGDAWIPAGGDARPQYGDIFRPKSFHMGISLDFDGDTWNTAESGQGGPKSRRDIIKRKQTAWDPSKLQGWVDLEIYFGEASAPAAPAAAAMPVPDWLVGWWSVGWRGQAFYYYFDRTSVRWTQTPPRTTSVPPPFASDTGSVTVEGGRNVTIVWGATGSVETFTRPADGGEMRGAWNGTEPLTAARMTE